MDVFPFTPKGLPTFAVIGVVLASIVAVPLFLGGIGMYIWEGIRGKDGKRKT